MLWHYHWYDICCWRFAKHRLREFHFSKAMVGGYNQIFTRNVWRRNQDRSLAVFEERPSSFKVRMHHTVTDFGSDIGWIVTDVSSAYIIIISWDLKYSKNCFTNERYIRLHFTWDSIICHNVDGLARPDSILVPVRSWPSIAKGHWRFRTWEREWVACWS